MVMLLLPRMFEKGVPNHVRKVTALVSHVLGHNTTLGRSSTIAAA